jgi:hypothetical protein
MQGSPAVGAEGETRGRNETLGSLAGAKVDEDSPVWERFQLGISRLEMYPQRNGQQARLSRLPNQYIKPKIIKYCMRPNLFLPITVKHLAYLTQVT